MESGSCQRPVPVAAFGPSDKLIPSLGRVDIYTFCFSDRSAGTFLCVWLLLPYGGRGRRCKAAFLEKQGFGEVQPLVKAAALPSVPIGIVLLLRP